MRLHMDASMYGCIYVWMPAESRTLLTPNLQSSTLYPDAPNSSNPILEPRMSCATRSYFARPGRPMSARP